MLPLFEKFKGLSLVRRLNGLILLMSTIVTVSFLSLFFAQRQTIAEYEAFTVDFSRLGELPFLLREAYQSFSSLVIEDDVEIRNKLDRVFGEIESTLSSNNGEIGGDDILFFRRTLMNMYTYWRARVNENLGFPRAVGQSAFSEVTYMRELAQAMEWQARNLVVSYLSAGNARNYQRMLVTKNLNLRLLWISVALIIIGLWAGKILTRRIAFEVRLLALASERIAKGDFSGKDLSALGFRELETVVQAFDRMRRSIQGYVTELKDAAETERELARERLANLEKDRLLRETQLHALQMQINPHFLFNALNIINRMALKKDDAQIITCVSAISKILRFNLRNEGELVDLRAEFDLVRAYIYIQSSRFGDRIEFRLPAFSEIPPCLCPPMILQPIVENAIVHGLKDCEGGGRIEIVIVTSGEEQVVTVHDNGKGIAPETAAAALAGHFESAGTRSSIGIYNVAKRLQLYFGREDLFSISSPLQGGTVVSIRLPVTRGGPV